MPLLNALDGWLGEKQQFLSKQTELAKALSYALNQWETLKYYASDGWAESDNNITENVLWTVSLGRKNYPYSGSDHAGGRGAQLYGLIGSFRLNGIDSEGYLCHVL